MNFYVCIKDYSYRIGGDTYGTINKGQVFFFQYLDQLPGMNRTEYQNTQREYWKRIDLNSYEGSVGCGYIKELDYDKTK